MNTNTAAYWIAVGVLALGLNSEYQHGRFVTLHRVAERAGSVVSQVSARAEESLAVATGPTDRRAIPLENLLVTADGAEMARDRVDMLREQARAQAELLREQVREQILAQRDVIHVQADVRRAEIEQFRWRTASQIRLAHMANRRVMVICPQTGTRITVKPGTELADIPSDVEVDDQN